MSKQPPPAPTASAIGPCPTIIQIVGCPGTGSNTEEPQQKYRLGTVSKRLLRGGGGCLNAFYWIQTLARKFNPHLTSR